MDISNLTLRELQTESARAMACIEATNNNIHRFNKVAHHDSQKWYRAVIEWYIKEYNGLPSMVGPGKEVILLHDNSTSFIKDKK